MTMKTTVRKRLLIGSVMMVLLFLLVSNSHNILAQSGTGKLTGKVVDAINKDPMPGANVYLQGTAIGATTDFDGNYRIANIPVGKYEVVISFLGYKKLTVPVEIIGGKTLEVNGELSWDVYDLGEEITVTGQLEGQAQAINQQVNSDQIVNIVSEQKIKELPDANAAESVGRLPGVAVQRDGGEASKLMIRGLDPKFANISVNGIQIPSTGAEERDVDLSLISQSTLTGIELYKALTADQDADAIAGVVNLVTGKARDKEEISVSLFGIYSGLTESAKQYKVSAQYNNRFFNGLLGVQAGINAEHRDRNREKYEDTWNLSENSSGQIEKSIHDLGIQYDDEKRGRYGANLNLDINTPDGG